MRTMPTVDTQPVRRRLVNAARRRGHRTIESAIAVAAIGLLITACGSATDPTAPASAPLESAGQVTPSTMTLASPAGIGSETEPTNVIEGNFDIGGYSLFMRCSGSGPVTVVYLHGAIFEEGMVPHTNALGIQARVDDDYRMCVYDRRNVGRSDAVVEVQDGAAVVADLHRLLEAADVGPPYVLLGASFGGLVAYLYANVHSNDVVGMVLLDAMFPDELGLDPLLPEQYTFEYFAEDDRTTPERIVHFDVITQAQEYLGKEPAIPVVYLASEQEPYDDNPYNSPEYDAVILETQEAYVDRFSPGTLIRVDAPHFMEPVIPGEIADAIRDVIDQGGY